MKESRFLLDIKNRGKFLVKVFTSELRIGLKEGLVEEAIARAFQAPAEEVRQANLLLGNIGETARLAAEHRLGSANVTPCPTS